METTHNINGFWSLYAGKTIFTVSSGLVGVFLPIFLYNIFNENFIKVALFYFVGHVIYSIFVIWGIKFLNNFGFKKALVISSIWGAMYYAVLYYLDQFGDHVSLSICLLLVFLTLFRLFFWIPYHVDFAKFSDKRVRGTQTGLVLATITAGGVLGPFIAGFIIDIYGFSALFIAIFISFLIGMIPFSHVPKTNERFEWTYSQTWKIFLKEEHRPAILSFVANGAENVIGIVVWPIFIFLLLDGNYFEVGALSSIIIGVSIILQLGTGKYLDDTKERVRILRTGTILYSLGWIVKIFVATAFQIFVVGIYHNLVKIFTHTPFDTMFYDMAADNGHYVDEFTILREIALSIGKSLSLLFVIIMSLFFQLQWTFIIAAFATILFNMVYMQKKMFLEDYIKR